MVARGMSALRVGIKLASIACMKAGSYGASGDKVMATTLTKQSAPVKQAGLDLDVDALLKSRRTRSNGDRQAKSREGGEKRAGGAYKRGKRVFWNGSQHEVEHLRPDELTPYARNPNLHPDEQVDLIVRSIEEFGFTVPLLADENGMILAGHGRQLAALKMHLALVPVIRMRGLSQAQKRAYVMADNQIARTSDFDYAMIAAELRALSEQYSDFDLGVIGFGDAEVQKFLDPLFGKQHPDTGKLLDVLRVSLDEPKHKVERGQLWDAGQHVVACLDLFTEWPLWIGELQEGTVLLPYAGPLVLLTERAKTTRVLVINPQAYVCAMILDKFVEAKLGKPKARK